MKHLLLIFLLFLSVCTFAEKRALVVGIGEYPDVDFGWHTINGDNDVPLVMEMLKCAGFQQNDIIMLKNQQATYNGIMQAFEQLVSQVCQGDIVYIHFSGHGQQITDLNGDEPDDWDEAWIPYDALQQPTDDYNGERHITDDILNALLWKIQAKIGVSGQLTVVTDACHSGDATRLIIDDIVRGSSAKFHIHGKKTASFTMQKQRVWIEISACLEKECNRQTTTEEGIPCGSLSYAMYLLRNEIPTIPLDSLAYRLRELMKPPFIARPQTPQVEFPQNCQNCRLFK